MKNNQRYITDLATGSSGLDDASCAASKKLDIVAAIFLAASKVRLINKIHSLVLEINLLVTYST